MAVTDLVDLAKKEIRIEGDLRDQARRDHAAAQTAERTARDAIVLELPRIHQLELAGDKPAELRRRRVLVAELHSTEMHAAAEGRAAAERAEQASARLAEWEARKALWTANQDEDTGEWPPLLAAMMGISGAGGEAETLIGDLDTRVKLVDIPPKLREAVRKRVRAAVKAREVAERRVATAEDRVAPLAGANAGGEAAAAVENRTYRRRRAEVAAFVRTARPVIAAANALKAEPLPTVPTAAKQKLDGPNAAGQTARKGAADAELELRDAEIDEGVKLLARDDAELAKLFDPAVSTTAAVNAHDTAVTKREGKATAFDTAKQELVLAWQADAPSAVWSYVARVEETLVALESIRDEDPDQMDDELVANDTAFAVALEKAVDDMRPWLTAQSRLHAVQLQRKATLEAPPSLSA